VIPQIAILKSIKNQMIISHKHRFIFIKTTKTAGTSTEVDLSKVIGEDDISTLIEPPVEGHIAQNYQYDSAHLYNHMSAEAVREYLGARRFNEYFKFCVEREPVSKCISHYSMLKNSTYHNKDTHSLSFEGYLSNRNFPIDTPKYVDSENRLLVDRILRYEDLEIELSGICSKLGFQFTLKSQAKAGFRENIHITGEQRKIIYEAFEESNEFTGYAL
jgi:hypothetical protein